MTSFRSPVTRLTERAYKVGHQKARPIAVRLLPGDVIAVREKGRRDWFQAPADWVARQIVARGALYRLETHDRRQFADANGHFNPRTLAGAA
jgi:hypothetical protein